MNNVFNTSKEIHKRYDLKGSTQGRTTKYANNIFDPTIALKDNDIIDEQYYFVVSEDTQKRLRAQIESDVSFFKENNIIDYSLLIGIHDMQARSNSRSRTIRDSIASESDYYAGNNPNWPFYEQNEGGMYNYNGSKIYFWGVIDILTEYNTKKKLEHFIKRLKYGNKISCVPPEFYAKRFWDFICNLIVTVDEYNSIAKNFHKNIIDDHFVHQPDDEQYSLSKIHSKMM